MDFEELKNKILRTLSQAADGAKDLAGKAADGAKDLAGKAADKAKAGTRIAKLSMDLAAAKEAQKKTYQEIGREYYSQHKDAPEDFFTQLFAEIEAADEKIAAMNAEIAELKAGMSAPDVEVEVEQTPAEPEETEETETPAEPEEAVEAPAEPEAPAEGADCCCGGTCPVEPAETPAEPEAPVDQE